MKFFRKDWILYDEIAKDGGQRPDTLIELRVRTIDDYNMNHIPIITKQDDGYLVANDGHQMNFKHHLVTKILKVDEQWVHRYDFKPTDNNPNVKFKVNHGKKVEAYVFCNLHGLYYAILE